MTENRRVLFVVTSHDRLGDTGRKTGWFLSEVAHPYRVLREAGFEIDFASPQGGTPPMDPSSEDHTDPVNESLLEDPAVMAALATSTPAEAIQPERYEAIFCAGGHGAMWDFHDNRALARAIRGVYERGGVVGAVCHGPAALVNVTLSNNDLLVAGKRVSAFTDEEEREVKLDQVVPFLLASTLVARGAVHEKAPLWQPCVSVDGRLVTGQNPASATGVGEAIRDLLGGPFREPMV